MTKFLYIQLKMVLNKSYTAVSVKNNKRKYLKERLLRKILAKNPLVANSRN